MSYRLCIPLFVLMSYRLCIPLFFLMSYCTAYVFLFSFFFFFLSHMSLRVLVSGSFASRQQQTIISYIYESIACQTNEPDRNSLDKQCHSSRDSWLETERQDLDNFLPVAPAGSGDSTADFRFVTASIRQQRLFARSMELRLGEYLETYDDQRMRAVEEAYRAGDIDRVCVSCVVCFWCSWAQ